MLVCWMCFLSTWYHATKFCFGAWKRMYCFSWRASLGAGLLMTWASMSIVFENVETGTSALTVTEINCKTSCIQLRFELEVIINFVALCFKRSNYKK